jgi:hypothetical protein
MVAALVGISLALTLDATLPVQPQVGQTTAPASSTATPIQLQEYQR